MQRCAQQGLFWGVTQCNVARNGCRSRTQSYFCNCYMQRCKKSCPYLNTVATDLLLNFWIYFTDFHFINILLPDLIIRIKAWVDCLESVQWLTYVDNQTNLLLPWNILYVIRISYPEYIENLLILRPRNIMSNKKVCAFRCCTVMFLLTNQVQHISYDCEQPWHCYGTDW